MKQKKHSIGFHILRGLLALVCLAVIAAAILVLKNPNPSRPESIDTPNGFVQAVGTNLYDGEGHLLQLRGVNLGNWFVPENYMSLATVNGMESMDFTQDSAMKAMKANPNLTEEDIQTLYDLYMQTYMTEDDFAQISALGLNTVRVPFTYRNLTDEEGNLYNDAFRYLDWAVDMGEKYGMYVILDLHGAYGSQNMDQHSGDSTQFHLYDSEENMAKTCALWETIAQRYKDRKTVAGYDLLNECRRAPHRYGGRINTDFYDRLYKTIRAVDPDHMIFIEYFSFPVNGAPIRDYGWDNVCIQYHIYNRTPFSQRMCLLGYKAMHNLTGNTAPVYIGEWNAFEREEDWDVTLDFCDELGWSWSSWAYKANRYPYEHLFGDEKLNTWGIYELNIPPVELSTATYEEIAEVYRHSATEYGEQTLIWDVYTRRLRSFVR